MTTFDSFSRDLALTLGERRGRTTSRRMGDAVGRLLDVDGPTGTHLVHGLMLMAVAVPQARVAVGAVLLLAFLTG